MKPLPRKPRGMKRALDDEEEQSGPSQRASGKRARIGTNNGLVSTSTDVTSGAFDFMFQVDTYVHLQSPGNTSQMYDPYSNAFDS
jgi:hypothetical protein